MDLTTRYMGFDLRNPLIAGSSGLTSKLDTIKTLEDQGVAAIVLKSLFEEDLICHIKGSETSHYPYPKTNEWIGTRFRSSHVDDYLQLIQQARKELSIPVIASINCVTPYEWTSFARKIEAAGAHALELNMFMLPSDPMRSSEESEKQYFDILVELRRQVHLPIAVKISPFFSGMTKMALKLSWTGISGMVLFNRYYQPDIDIEALKVVQGNILSDPSEMNLPLRWVALLSDRVMCDVAAGTAAYDHVGMVKYLLAGARAIQVTSAFYRHGIPHAATMLQGLSEWMERHQFGKIQDFQGILSLKKTENPADYERFQYLKTYGGED